MEVSQFTGKILLAEDCVDTQQVLQLMLEQVGAEVVVANNGKECIDKVHADDFQLIVLDIKMPVVDGLEALRTLRKEGFSQPVVAITASPDEETKSRMESLGVEAFLSKLSDRKEIVPTISSLLRKIELKAERTKTESDPILPSFIPTTEKEFESIEEFYRVIKVRSSQLRDLIRRQAYGEIAACLEGLEIASSVGYEMLESQMVALRNALKSSDTVRVHEEVQALDGLLQGVLQGKKTIERDSLSTRDTILH